MKTQYVLITPVHNEADRIVLMFKCILAQTIRPAKWVIVNDGSTDNTAALIEANRAKYDFIIQLQPVRSDSASYYAYRTQAVIAGYQSIKDLAFDFVACLDSDLSIQPTYYENVLTEFHNDPKLGIATGVYVNERSYGLEKVIRDCRSTPGGLQVFRRECYEAIGGYRPLRYGGDDSLADIMARMHGWKTRSFPMYEAIHHRPTGTAGEKHIFKARFFQGYAEYNLATHPLFMVAKSLRRAFVEKPYVTGSMARLFGYINCSLRKADRDIPKEVAEYVRKEQLKRLLWWKNRDEM